MGGLVTKAVDQNMKSNQEFMIEMNRITVRHILIIFYIISILLFNTLTALY